MSDKECFKCGTVKPLSEFYKHLQMADGHLGKCKECAKADIIARRKANIEHYREYDRERAKRPERKAKILVYQQRRRSKDPEKCRAHRLLIYHVRAGNITRKPCEVCGKVHGVDGARVEGHHDDYSKPLDVRWLCFKHHRMEHGKYQDD